MTTIRWPVWFVSVFLFMIFLMHGAESVYADKQTTDLESSCVILLHGLGRTSNSMDDIARSLAAREFLVWNVSYLSTENPVGELAIQAITPALEFCQASKAGAIHFVTHSLGGILVRYYLQDHKIDNLGRIVMLSPPNKGSEIVDELREFKFYQYVMGPAGQQLGTGESSVPNRLEPIDGEIGIIIGNSSSDPWFSWLIPGEDDGKVSVARARLDEMKDFLVVDHGHTFIMNEAEVIGQIEYFLINGNFDHSN